LRTGDQVDSIRSVFGGIIKFL